MPLEVRRVTEVTEPLRDAMARLMPQLSARLSAPPDERLRQIVAWPSSALFAAWDGERAVGVLTLVWYDVPSGRKAWIEDVVVDDAARGCGAGRALVEAALELAAKVGAEAVMLTSSPARMAARELYRKMGFKEVDTTVFTLKMK